MTKKMILMATLTPIMPTKKIRAGGDYSSADLGKLLRNMLPEGCGKLVLQRKEMQRYVQGLRDAHMMEAAALDNMFAKVETVEVTFHEEEDN